MAYNESTRNRIREILLEKNIDFSEKKMFAGVCIFLDGKMMAGTHIDKKSGGDFLLCRVGEDVYEACLEHENCIPMEFTGKAMKGYVFVVDDGFNSKKQLAYWLQLCIDFNPLAKKSKK